MPRTVPHDPHLLTVGRTSVRFKWAGDRWMHHVFFDAGAAFGSVEGSEPDGDPRWPASPVIVELSRLHTAAGPALLGVGVAGRSHFSASVAPDPDRESGVRFEIACRVNERPVWLGSTYRGAAGVVRVVPAAPPAGFPATVEWAYMLCPEGITVRPGSSLTASASAGD